MSLHWRIMGATVLVVVASVLITVGVGYYATQSRLGVFVDEIGDDEALLLARSLSREYTAAGGWETVDGALSEAGYGYGGDRSGEGSGERSEGGEEGHVEALHQDPVRVVIVDIDGRVVSDNAAELPPGAAAPDLGGYRETVIDLSTNQPVGHAYVDIDHEFLSNESSGFLGTFLYITLVGGVITAGVAVLVAAWLSRRISGPVTALTEATQAIADGDTTRLPVTSSDELGRMSAAFNRMTFALESQRELRRRLVNDVSHELNTPLSVIQLEATGLRDGLQTPESASGHIIQEIDRLRGLVIDLDSLAETDYGEMRLTLEATSVSDLLTAEVARWQPQTRARGVALSLEAPGDIPETDLDRMRMSQALGNVVNNAIHCSEAGGAIVIRAGLEGDETLAISVVDDGIGIHASDLPHVLDRFYRTDQSRIHGTTGTGLGLAITRAIVEAHGGTITVTSDGPGQGAAVTMRVPVKSRVP